MSANKLINLREEIEVRSRLNESLNRLIEGLIREETGESSLESLAESLLQVSEERKELERLEKSLKDRLSALLPPEGVFSNDRVSVVKQIGSNSYLERARILQDLGPEFMAKYSYTVEFTKITPRRIK